MLIDLNSTEKLVSPLHYDVCVCGAGPAGISIARVLANAGKRVALIEGGGLEYSEDSQDIYRGKSIGYQYWDGLFTNRLRYLGGTSNHWGGRCSYFDPVDFELRSYHGMPGWPISRDEVMQWAKQAQSIVDISDQAFAGSIPDVKWQGPDFRYSDVAHSPPTRFKTKYFRELKDSTNIDLYVNANLTDIRLENSLDSVSGIEVRNYGSGRFVFSARNYVLAFGAIENARMLLNADKQISRGIGNHGDMVGRCFMEHLNVDIGRFVVDDMSMWNQLRLEMNPSAEFMRKNNIGNGVLAFAANAELKTYGRLKVLKKYVRDTICKSDLMTDISRRIVDFPCPGDGVVSSLIEQVPNPDSRVSIGPERDRLGLRRVILNWQLNDSDYRTIRKLGMGVAKEMAKTNVARVQLNKSLIEDTGPIDGVHWHCHHMGTTRMSEDPKYGVVDKNLKIHGVDNLFVVGSSVFPTGGGCNPTFTLVMLALRLGHHIAQLRTG